MTENIFSVLGFLITFRRSTADNYKQGLYLSEDHDFNPSEIVLGQYHTPTSSNGNDNSQPNFSRRTWTWVARPTVSFYFFSKAILTLANRWLVATTTIWSGVSYMFGRNGFRIVAQKKKIGSMKTKK